MAVPPFFMFATGIENSDTHHSRRAVARRRDGQVRALQALARRPRAGVRDRRKRAALWPPVSSHDPAHGRFDWEFADQAFAEIRRLELVPIVDLCHFGVPDWIGNFQNPDFPALFADYARAFAQRFPWVQLYTPVNEMFICATFSAAYGWWNEQLRDDRAFVTALKHIVKANVLAMHAILDVRPDAIFIQSESSEYFHAEDPARHRAAET